eukprot:m.186156 g.186156  ORF g.186156 m.186156 type:complete len:864 (-) comp24757_c0_seq1:70-2661(-)
MPSLEVGPGARRSSEASAARQRLEQRLPPPTDLSITVVSAVGLKKSGWGSCDPFVKLSVGGVSQESKVVRGTVSPVWNERFRFKEARPSSSLKVSVWNFRKAGKGDDVRQRGLLGSAEIPLGFLADIDGALPLLCESFALASASGAGCGDLFLEFRAHVSSQPARRRSTTAVGSSAHTARPSPRTSAGKVSEQGATPRPRSASTNLSRTASAPTSSGAPRRPSALAAQRSVGQRRHPTAAKPRDRGGHDDRQAKGDDADDTPLPAGWEIRLTPAGRTYYANHSTRQTTWVRPVTERLRPPPARRAASRQEYERRSLLALGRRAQQEENYGFPGGNDDDQTAGNVGRPHSPPEVVPLRAGPAPAPSAPRSAVESIETEPSQRRPEASPIVSRRSVGGAPSSPYHRHWEDYIIEEDMNEFPIGWEQRETPTGRPYFVDHINRSTTFIDPRIEHREERKKLALQHDAVLPKYKRDLRRKLLRLRDLFTHQFLQYKTALGSNPNKDQLLRVEIAISRPTVLEDSFRVLAKCKSHMLIGKLNITFLMEDALDYGGVSREWFYELSRAMLNPQYALFEPCGSDQYLLKVNPASGINPDHLTHFRCVGRVLGLAVKHGHYIEGGFIMPIFKTLLGKLVSLEDMQHVDPTFYNSLLWILENEIAGIIDNTFVDEHLSFGEVTAVELKSDGANIAVTDENKREYVDLIVQHRLLDGIVEQSRAIKAGFDDVVPVRFMDMFDEKELELLVCGLGEVNVSDWAANTEYRHCTSADPVTRWFWQAVEGMDNEMRARLLQFSTGTSRVPVTGFADLKGSLGPKKFTVEVVEGNSAETLPKAHTCFNRIELSPYNSYEQLEAKLFLAVDNTMGFGIE